MIPDVCLQVFDVHSGVSKFLLPGSGTGAADNEVRVPWGAGLLGYVAETGQTVNLSVACEVNHPIYLQKYPSLEIIYAYYFNHNVLLHSTPVAETLLEYMRSNF